MTDAYCRPATLTKLDGRTKEGVLLRRMQVELTAHIGGKPSITQRLLIVRAAVLALRCAQFGRVRFRFKSGADKLFGGPPRAPRCRQRLPHPLRQARARRGNAGASGP